jgi:GMP reductase
LIKKNKKMNKQGFDFKDFTLLPKMAIVNSRSECDTSINFGKHKFKLPIVPANMESVINHELAEKLAANGFFYILHRFNANELDFVKDMKSKGLFSSISLGVNEDSYQLLHDMKNNDLTPDYITIDIAHGHAIKMKKMVEYIKSIMPETFVIGGNVCTPEAVNDLENWGCDAVKCGIAAGSACTTDPSTGFGNRGWQASMIEECAKFAKKPIIADGGIKRPSDIAKSLALGASIVMVGGMLTGFEDSPGNVVEHEGKKFKEFWGSASQFQSNKKNRVEGKKILVEFKNKSVFDELKYIEECLQSSISYSGGKDIDSLNYVSKCFFNN